MAGSRSERGVALILVLVVLPLVAILMTQLHFETAIGDRLSSNMLANQQFKQAIRGRLEQVRLVLVRDLKDDEQGAQQEGGAFDHYGDPWGPATEGGKLAASVTKGDKERGDEITLLTSVVDEQSKFNLNLLRHNDPPRRARARETLKALLDLFRDSRYRDLEDNDFDLSEEEAIAVTDAIVKFLEGDERDERIPKPQVPDPTPDMKQGVYTVDDLVFCHELFLQKRLLETFVDPASGQRIPGLDRFLTVHGDGRVNANTAPIQVLRAMFLDVNGRTVCAEGILRGRGGYLDTDDDEKRREETEKERKEAKERGDEERLEEMQTAYKSVNDLLKVEGMNEPGFGLKNQMDLGRDFCVRSNFFTVVVTARREAFLRQQRVVLERHASGAITHSSEVREADMADVPEEESGASQSGTQP